VHNSKRTLENATVFIGKIKEKSNQKAPLFYSDCWFYEQTLIDTYSTLIEVADSGRGRPSNPIPLIDKDLCYVQVHKKRDTKGKIEKISTRIVLGHEFKVLEILDHAKRCKTINTDYVESRNGKFRKDNARLIRKTLCLSKKRFFMMLKFDYWLKFSITHDLTTNLESLNIQRQKNFSLNTNILRLQWRKILLIEKFRSKNYFVQDQK
jgi:hypothetical protein